MIYLVSMSVFSSIIVILVSFLLFIETKILKKGSSFITINNDKKIEVSEGTTLLSALVSNNILIPSACGGKGSCGACKCIVEEGGGSILPTELSHLNRQQRKDNLRLACQLKIKEDLKIRVPDEIFSIKKYFATVVSNENVATFIKELVLKLDPGQSVDFKAGAYMQIDIPEYKEIMFKDFNVAQTYRPAWDRFKFWNIRAKGDKAVFRAYSLANPPYEKDVLKFTIRIATPPPGKTDIPPGVGSSYVFNLRPGSKVSLSGPYGDFFVNKTNREICFIGGGAGMAPMRCHILHQLHTEKTNRKITFWYGARSKSEMFYDEEFSELAQKYNNFSYYVALSDPQPEDKWKGLVGFIHQCLYDNYLKTHDDPTEIEYYLCGPPMMIDAIENLLFDLGVESNMIKYDKF